MIARQLKVLHNHTDWTLVQADYLWYGRGVQLKHQCFNVSLPKRQGDIPIIVIKESRC